MTLKEDRNVWSGRRQAVPVFMPGQRLWFRLSRALYGGSAGTEAPRRMTNRSRWQMTCECWRQLAGPGRAHVASRRPESVPAARIGCHLRPHTDGRTVWLLLEALRAVFSAAALRHTR